MIQAFINNQRFTCVVILIVAVLAMTFAAVAPHVGAYITYRNIVINSDALLKLQGLTGNAGHLKRENNELHASNDHLKLLLLGDTTGIAGAELQRLLLNRLARHNGRATTFQVQSPKAEKNLTRISIALAFRIDIKGLRNLLLDLETSTPLLFVTSLSTQPVETVNSRSSRSRMLDVTIQVSGYLPGTEAS